MGLGFSSNDRGPMDYPSNSKSGPPKGPQREKRVDSPVIEGKVVPKKPTMGKRVANIFIMQDPKLSAKEAARDVLLPGVRKIIFDTLMQSLSRVMLNENRPIRSGLIQNTVGTFGQQVVQYNKPTVRQSQQNPGAPQRGLTWQQRSQHNYDDLVYESLDDVIDVINTLKNLIDEYGQARVSDLYDKIGITSDFTDDTWGWIDLTEAGYRYDTQGYLLKLPAPIPFSNL